MPPATRVTRSSRAKASRLFAALGDETRLHLVARLSKEGPLSITQLSSGSAKTRQAITKHLHALERAGVASSHRGGRERIWMLEPDRLESMQLYLDGISSRWDTALARLQHMVETEE